LRRRRNSVLSALGVAFRIVNVERRSARLMLLTAQIGEQQGALRAVHLKYHLTTAELLSADQSELRGYR